MNFLFGYSFFNGVSIINEEADAFCFIDNEYKTNIKSLRKQKRYTKFFKYFFIRGIAFLIFSLIFIIKNMFFLKKNEKNEKNTKETTKISNKLNIPDNIIISSIIFFIAISVAIFLFGLIPLKISIAISPLNFNIFLKKFIVALVKTLMLGIVFLSLKLSPAFRQLFRFCGATNVVINNYKNVEMKNNYYLPTNFLTYLFFSFFNCFFVLSLLGEPFSKFIFIVLNFVLVICVFAFSFEICYYVSRTKSIFIYNLLFPFYVLSANKPLKSEIVMAQTALNEVGLMEECFSRQEISDALQSSEKLGYSFVMAEVKDKMKSAGITDSAEAEWLVATVLNKNRAECKLVEFISRDEYLKIKSILNRRMKGEPLTKIFGWTEFYGLKFKVNNDVLSPRQETEILVEEVLKLAKEKDKILDVCTGSGIIAISLAKSVDAKITAVDISKQALLVASENAKLNNVNVKFVESDMFSGLKNSNKFDIIVSNPPYVKSEDIPKLSIEVKNYDPMLALDGGKDGLQFYRQIANDAPKHLNSEGILALEIGKSQNRKVVTLLKGNFEIVAQVKDYAKIVRVIIAKKRK